MKLLWIGSQKDAPKGAECRSIMQTPSLTALALQQADTKSPDAMILDVRNGLPYSLPHLLDAAGRLQRLEIFFCVLASESLCRELSARTGHYFLCHTDRKELLRALAEQKSMCVAVTEPQKAPPLSLPGGKQLIVNVYGSQSRIGCTTQCLRLYRWLAASGLHPAVAVSAEELSALMRVLAAEDLGSFAKIEGIPFVTAADGDFNCYLRDCGVIDAEKVQKNADISILVTGAKPWELGATVAALAFLRDAARLALIGSFAPKGSGAQLVQLVKRCQCHATVLLASWQPDPFSADVPPFQKLRPLFEF